jgi:hypothetical protein
MDKTLKKKRFRCYKDWLIKNREFLTIILTIILTVISFYSTILDSKLNSAYYKHSFNSSLLNNINTVNSIENSQINLKYLSLIRENCNICDEKCVDNMNYNSNCKKCTDICLKLLSEYVELKKSTESRKTTSDIIRNNGFNITQIELVKVFEQNKIISPVLKVLFALFSLSIIILNILFINNKK